MGNMEEGKNLNCQTENFVIFDGNTLYKKKGSYCIKMTLEL
jgi:hypothetical protein